MEHTISNVGDIVEYWAINEVEGGDCKKGIQVVQVFQEETKYLDQHREWVKTFIRQELGVFLHQYFAKNRH